MYISITRLRLKLKGSHSPLTHNEILDLVQSCDKHRIRVDNLKRIDKLKAEIVALEEYNQDIEKEA